MTAIWRYNFGDGSTTGYYGVPKWQAGTIYSTGSIVRQNATPSFGNERCFRNNGAQFTSGGSEPGWTLTIGSTTADNGGTWTEVTGNSTYGWNAPHARLHKAMAWAAGGDTIFAGDNSREATTGQPNLILSFSGTVISVDHTVASPTSVNYVKGAVWSADLTTGNGFGFATKGDTYYKGMKFRCGTGGSTYNGVNFNQDASHQVFDDCTFEVGLVSSTGIGNPVNTSGGTGGITEFINGCSFNMFTGCYVWGRAGKIVFRDNPALSIGTNIGFISIANNQNSAFVEAIDNDWSAMPANSVIFYNNTNYPVGKFTCMRFKLNATSSLYNAMTSVPGPEVDWAWGGSTAGPNSLGRANALGQHAPDATVFRTGGDPASWKITPVNTGTPSWVLPFEALPTSGYNATTGAPVTVTFYGLWNDSVLPLNDQIWFDARYFGDAASSLGSVVSGTKANVLASGAAWSADTSSWNATARQNTHAYAAGDTMVPLGNPRVFICIKAGTSAGSEPGGYASAVDGGTVTDGGTAIFMAAMRFKMSVSVTPQLAGLITSYIRAAFAPTASAGAGTSTTTWTWLDPVAVLS